MRSGPLSAALAALLVLGSGCKKEIYHGLTEAEANEIVVALADADIASDKIAAGADKHGSLFTIAVEEEFAVEGKRVLIKSRLPREHEHGLRDAFSSPSMIPTEMEEKARYLTALQGDIAATLEQIDGIVDAKVHLVMPETNPLEASRDLTTARAAVLVKWQDSKQAVSTEDQTKRERDVYFSMLVAINNDIRELRGTILRDLKDAAREEKNPLVSLETFLKDQQTTAGADARKKLNLLQGTSLKRDGAIGRLENLPKFKDLDEVIKSIEKVEESLPFGKASIRSLVARATPRLEEDDIAVEFTKVQPKPPSTKTAVLAGPWWFKQNYMMGLAAFTAAFAAGLIGLALYLMSLMKQLEQARKAAGKAAASLGASLTGGTT